MSEKLNLYEKINVIMGSIESLQKDGRAEFGATKYKFLSEAKTTAEVRKELIKHKIVILPIGVEESMHDKITHGKYIYKMVNVENPEEFIVLESGGQGHDSTDKGSGKASTYAYKYMMWRTFAIPSNDDPDQITSEETEMKEKKAKAKEELDFEKMAQEQIGKTQAGALRELIVKFGADEKKLCEFYKVVGVEAMTNEQYSTALVDLRKKYSKDK